MELGQGSSVAGPSKDSLGECDLHKHREFGIVAAKYLQALKYYNQDATAPPRYWVYFPPTYALIVVL
jgi:hypothetical protein